VTDPSGVATTVHLLRHGRVHNPDGILYGRLPGYRLSVSGLAMADAAAESLNGHDIRYLAASSLDRAQQTAGAFADRVALPIVTDDRLIEADNVFAGTQVTGAGGSLFKPSNWAKLRNPRTPSWGEPYLDIAHRMLGAIYTAQAAAAGAEAVLVSHQLPIWTIRRFLTGKRLWHSPTSRQCSLASLTSLLFVDGVFQEVRYSEPAAHIDAADDPVEAGA
jgi:broad specificity phosphatase PhoE